MPNVSRSSGNSATGQGSNSANVRLFNERVILDALSRLAQASKADLSRHVNLTNNTAAILNLHERIENKLFLDRTRKDSNFKRPHICATLFQIEKC